MMLRLRGLVLLCLGAVLWACSGDNHRDGLLLVAVIDADEDLRNSLTRIDVESTREGTRRKISLPLETIIKYEGAPLDHITFAAGDTFQVSGSACAQTADHRVYCWGKFSVPDPSPAGDLGAYPSTIRIMLP